MLDCLSHRIIKIGLLSHEKEKVIFLFVQQQNSNPLLKIDWLRIVLDEGHMIRNPNAQQTKAICQLKAQRKWILTGIVLF